MEYQTCPDLETVEDAENNPIIGNTRTTTVHHHGDPVRDTGDIRIQPDMGGIAAVVGMQIDEPRYNKAICSIDCLARHSITRSMETENFSFEYGNITFPIDTCTRIIYMGVGNQHIGIHRCSFLLFS